MQEDNENLTGIEAALAGLTPMPGRIDRDRLMFQAGQTVARPGWMWPTVSGVLSVATLTLLVAVARAPKTRVVERLVYVSRPAPAQPARKDSSAPTLEQATESISAVRMDELPNRNPRIALEEQIMRWGLESLPDVAPSVPSEPPLSVRDMLDADVKKNTPSPLFDLGAWFHLGDKS
jgi:hypothetical protein